MIGTLIAIGPNTDRPVEHNPSWRDMGNGKFNYLAIPGLENGKPCKFQELPTVGYRFRADLGGGHNIDTSLVMEQRPEYVENYTLIFKTYYSIFRLEVGSDL